jgi:hypothetical protein
MPDCCIQDDLMYHFIINSNKMKEPFEVQQMKTIIETIYQDKVKQNFKNIETLPTVYDPVQSNISTQEGFKKMKKLIKKGVNKLNKPDAGFTLWKAPSSGPPKNGPILDIKNNPADEVDSILKTGESLAKFFSSASFSAITPKEGDNSIMENILKPFDKLPCIQVFPLRLFSIKYWRQYFLFLTDSIPALIEGYSMLFIESFADSRDFKSTKQKQNDTEYLKTSIIEFFYILIAGYISILLFYYSVIDTSYIDNPLKIIPIPSDQPLKDIGERLVDYAALPFLMMNYFISTILPTISEKMGLLPYHKLNFMFLFFVSLVLIYNQSIELIVDMTKKSFEFKAHAVIYMITVAAVLFKLFDLNVFNNVSESGKNLVFTTLNFFLVLILIIIAFLVAPITQFCLVCYILYLFLIGPLLKGLSFIETVRDFLNNPNQDVTCEFPAGEFFGELSRIITTYVYPYLLQIVLGIYFIYRLFLLLFDDTINPTCYNSKNVKLIMMYFNIICMAGIIGMQVISSYMNTNFDKTVIINDTPN